MIFLQAKNSGLYTEVKRRPMEMRLATGVFIYAPCILTQIQLNALLSQIFLEASVLLVLKELIFFKKIKKVFG